MRFVHKIRALEREIAFQDAAEKRPFWRSSAIGLRHLAVWVQVFGIVFTGEERAACALAEQLCESVAKLRVAAHVVAVSIGIRRFSETRSPAEIFRVADQGLYQAKRHGKNRYVLAS